MFGIWLVVINIINGYVLPYRQSLSRRMTLPTITLPKVHFTDSSFHRQFISPTVHFTDNSFHGQFISPTIHFTDSSFHRQFISPTVHFTDNLQWKVFTIIDNLLLFNNMKHSEYSE